MWWWTRVVPVVLGRHDHGVERGREGRRNLRRDRVLALISGLLACDPCLPQILAKDFEKLGRDISNDAHVASKLRTFHVTCTFLTPAIHIIHSSSSRQQHERDGGEKPSKHVL